MGQGVKLRELPVPEHEAYKQYDRERVTRRGEELRAKVRAWYRKRKAQRALVPARKLKES